MLLVQNGHGGACFLCVAAVAVAAAAVRGGLWRPPAHRARPRSTDYLHSFLLRTNLFSINRLPFVGRAPLDTCRSKLEQPARHWRCFVQYSHTIHRLPERPLSRISGSAKMTTNLSKFDQGLSKLDIFSGGGKLAAFASISFSSERARWSKSKDFGFKLRCFNNCY